MKFFVLVSLICLSFNLYAQTNTNYSGIFEGRYRCTGYDFVSKTNYQQFGEIKKTGHTYSFIRHDPKAGAYNATGLINGPVISFVFWNDSGKDADIGIATYTMQPNGDLKGNWSVTKSQIVSDDICTRIK